VPFEAHSLKETTALISEVWWKMHRIRQVNGLIFLIWVSASSFIQRMALLVEWQKVIKYVKHEPLIHTGSLSK